MSIYYKKLYTKQITLPFIKWEGCSSDNTDYYAVLEKNYIPVASTETWDTSNGDWVSVGLSPEIQNITSYPLQDVARMIQVM